MHIANAETVRMLRAAYPAGTRVELLAMDDPYSDLIPGDSGTVTHVDDTGSVHVSWDRGFTLAVLYDIDRIRKK